MRTSLRSKRFVRDQRKSEKQDFQCFARTKNGARHPSFGEEKLKLFVNNLRTPQKLKFFDRHMSIKFDYPSQSRVPFADEGRLSKCRGFVCKPFLHSPPPSPSFVFWLFAHFSRGKNTENPNERNTKCTAQEQPVILPRAQTSTEHSRDSQKGLDAFPTSWHLI